MFRSSSSTLFATARIWFKFLAVDASCCSLLLSFSRIFAKACISSTVKSPELKTSKRVQMQRVAQKFHRPIVAHLGYFLLLLATLRRIWSPLIENCEIVTNYKIMTRTKNATLTFLCCRYKILTFVECLKTAVEWARVQLCFCSSSS